MGFRLMREKRKWRALVKFIVMTLLLTATAAPSPPKTGRNAIKAPAQAGSSQEGGVMSVSLGENSKMTVRPSERERLERFYRDVLGCNVITKSKTLDIIQMGKTFFIGVVYDDSALSDSDFLKSPWLDLRTDRPEELKRRILSFGIKEIQYWDKEHFYFQAPGGQVFRLVGKNEDMSKWQQ